MARFYFDTADGSVIRDKVEMEFNDIEDARREAVITVGEMPQDILPKRR